VEQLDRHRRPRHPAGRFIRHPVYAGYLALVLGCSVASLNVSPKAALVRFPTMSR
jgi:hypothetical protein